MKNAFAAALLSATLLVSTGVLAADLKVGTATSTTSVDPQFYVGGSNSALLRNMFDGLVNQDDKQQIIPAVA
ncbi:MAG: ABC transporter substrate-binding protein, partial [Methylobacteriaceae bacterium]|nr:ABC transporter substrate-binding protein [Methylobacteriaceae bacterium]